MLYIDNTYFIKNLSVPHTAEPTSDASIELDSNIDRYVNQFLKLTLGNVLFEELKTNTTNGELIISAPQKWFNLVDGCNYTKDGTVYTWQGLRYSDGAFKVSLLANYVYLNQYQTTVNSMLGQVSLEGKNGINNDATPHLVEIWNEFVEMYQGIYNCNPQQYYRNGALFIDYYGNRESGYVSYLQFLLDNSEDYPNVPANSIEYKNSLGI
jgi:hypothetical protein